MFKKILVIVFALLISGCITTGLTPEDNKRFDEERQREQEKEFEPYVPSPHDFNSR